MAGEAKTSAFMLGTATVMIGAQGDVFDLNPADHSVGLVKNFRVTSEPQYTDLMQGVKNSLIFSVMTQNTVRASMEVFEYTSSNIAYSLGLEGSGLVAQTVTTTLSAAALASDTDFTVVSETGILAGDWVMVQNPLESDNAVIRQISSVAAGTLSFTRPLTGPVAINSIVTKVNEIGIGSKEDQPFLAAKVVGQLADGTEVAIICPKIRVTNGFSVGFTNDNFDNLPYEWSFYDLVTSDPLYSEFRGKQASLFTNK